MMLLHRVLGTMSCMASSNHVEQLERIPWNRQVY